MSSGIVVFAHGSRVESANEAVRRVAEETARAGGFEHVEAAFLELGLPDLSGALARLAQKGVRRVVIVPYFLTDGLHLERDLPPLVADASERFPGLEITATASLDGHPGLARIVADRAREILGE